MPLYPVIFMLIVLPALIIIEGVKMVKNFTAKRGWQIGALEVLILALSIIALAFWLFSY